MPSAEGAAAAAGTRPSSPPPLAPGERTAGHVSEAAVQAWLPLCTRLPKTELHAHINGCVRDSTIRRARVPAGPCVRACCATAARGWLLCTRLRAQPTLCEPSRRVVA
jgi:hypothetical protein